MNFRESNNKKRARWLVFYILKEESINDDYYPVSHLLQHVNTAT